MRVTNTMINKTSMNNMNKNKVSVNSLNTQMTTQKKINRPSEDPVIAIRSLRLRSDLSELDQYYGKNIPDAESWLDLTETALSNMRTLVTDIYKQCVNGATDTLNQEDRNAILQNLQQLRTQVYKEGNADSGGRTIFTGFKTSSQLTFEADEADTTYTITEKISYESIEEKNYYSNQVTVPTEEVDVMQGMELEKLPKETTNFRMRLSYDSLSGTDASLTDVTINVTAKDGTKTAMNATTKSYEEWAKDGFAVGDDEMFFIPESGELVMGKNVSEEIKGAKGQLEVTYNKTGFKEGEIRPEHYFDCVNTTNPDNHINYVKENQEIEYTISFNQTIAVNTQASDVFNAAMGRDIDELTEAVRGAIAAHEKVEKIQDMMKQEQYASPEAQEKLKEWLEAAEKEAAYMDDNMQKLYSAGIGNFQGYLDDISLAITDVGSKGNRLELTKNRVGNQQTAFEKLKSTNEDRDLSEIIVDYTAAYTAYQASLMASSKANQQTLLDYL